jgi:hypothetical protein
MTTPRDPSLRDTSDCGCCSGTGPSTPGVIHNRPGLSAIAYRSGTWHEFKESLLAALSGSAHPELAGLATRADHDFTIALLDAVAVVGDVLTFYQERIANESYLRTATERLSVLELARLIGYELKPGVAASTLLAFTVEDAAGAPLTATIDIGVKVQSVPGHEEKPQTFETIEKIEARAEWNAMRPKRTAPQSPASMSTSLWLSGVATDLRIGDVLLLVGPEREASSADEHWDARFVANVQPDFDAQRTLVTFGAQIGPAESGIAPSSAPRAFAMRVRASSFGYNAAEWKAMSLEFKKNYLDETGDLSAAQKKEWPDFVVTSSLPLQTLNLAVRAPVASNAGPERGPGDIVGTEIVATLAKSLVHLDQVYAAVQPGSWMLLATPDLMELYRVSSVAATSRAEFGLSGKTTRVSLAGENLSKFDKEVRSLAIYGHSQELTIAEAPIAPAETGFVSSLTVEGAVGDLPQGRTLLVKGFSATDGSPLTESLVLDSVEVVGANSRLVFTTALVNNYRLDGLLIHGNVALATHGETVAEVLGAGNAAVPYQRLALRQAPLTFVRNATSASGASSTLGVRVNDVLWTEVPSFYLRTPNERVYATRLDDAGNTVVHFGDGVHGSRLPTGRENIRATYRKGIGRGGNVRAEQLSTLLTRPLGLKAAINPQPATGGDDAETLESAGENAPVTVLTLDRAVSLQDYADFARGYAGIAKALATWSWDGERRGVFITVAGPDGTAVSEDVIDLLTSAIRNASDPFVPLRIMSFRAASFRTEFRLKYDPLFDKLLVSTAVTDALRASFGFAGRAFGQPVALSEVIASIQRVAGVVAVDVDQLRRTDFVGGFGLVATLPSSLPQADSLSNTLPAELLTLSSDPLIIGEMP